MARQLQDSVVRRRFRIVDLFRQYDIVRIVGFTKPAAMERSLVNKRPPEIGDIAAIVEIYEQPKPGYELECTNGDQTEWLQSFAAEDIQLELLS